MSTCLHCKAEHPPDHYDRVVHNKTALHGPWQGWRMAGRYLVGPDGQRITPERLRGLAWRVGQEERLDAAKARNSGHRGMVTVLRIENADWHRDHFGQVAG